MSSLGTLEANLPPGFRFHPRDDELVCDYLVRSCVVSAGDGGGCHRMLVGVDLSKCEPWDLPEMARVGGREWYFLSLRDRKYATGRRANRATESGYWKATGRDRAVSRRGMVVGMRKTLVFYQGRAPRGTKTHWIMHEFRLILPAAAAAASSSSLCDDLNVCHPLDSSSIQEDKVLCRVVYKSRSGRVSTSMPTMEEEQKQETSSSNLPTLTDPATWEILGCQQQQQQQLYLHDHAGGLASSSSSSPSGKLVSSVLSYFTMNPKGEEVQLPLHFSCNVLPSMGCNPAQYFS